MRITYDAEADAMYIKFRETEVDHTQEINENTIIDFDKDGQVIGVEILFVRECNPDLLKGIQVENLLVPA